MWIIPNSCVDCAVKHQILVIQWNSDLLNVQGKWKLVRKIGGFEKSKVASNQTCFTADWFYKIQEGRQQRYITLVNA